MLIIIENFKGKKSANFMEINLNGTKMAKETKKIILYLTHSLF